MVRKDVNQYLCVHDPRNEFYQDMIAAGEEPEEMPEPRVDCYCANCFNGRDKLALEILRLMDILDAECINL